jgi:hypothetical protein
VLLLSCSGPREDATRIGSAGVVRRQAVDISPLRRVNQAIYLLTTGARESAFRNIKTIAECLADELINAAKGSSNRYICCLAASCLSVISHDVKLFSSVAILVTVTPSRRRTRLSVLPRPTVERSLYPGALCAGNFYVAGSRIGSCFTNV